MNLITLSKFDAGWYVSLIILINANLDPNVKIAQTNLYTLLIDYYYYH